MSDICNVLNLHILFQDTGYSNLSSSSLVSWWHFSSLMYCAMNTSLISCLEKLWSIDTRYDNIIIINSRMIKTWHIHCFFKLLTLVTNGNITDVEEYPLPLQCPSPSRNLQIGINLINCVSSPTKC